MYRYNRGIEAFVAHRYILAVNATVLASISTLEHELSSFSRSGNKTKHDVEYRHLNLEN